MWPRDLSWRSCTVCIRSFLNIPCIIQLLNLKTDMLVQLVEDMLQLVECCKLWCQLTLNCCRELVYKLTLSTWQISVTKSCYWRPSHRSFTVQSHHCHSECRSTLSRQLLVIQYDNRQLWLFFITLLDVICDVFCLLICILYVI